MIRRLIALVALTIAVLVLSAGPAGAANGNVLCLYARNPPSIGLCLGV